MRGPTAEGMDGARARRWRVQRDMRTRLEAHYNPYAEEAAPLMAGDTIVGGVSGGGVGGLSWEGVGSSSWSGDFF
eukprot:1189372-Prorocentrum_minimum.AAC.3